MTITLSITASMNRPNEDTSPRARAIIPSNQSVSAAAMKSQKAMVAAHSKSWFISQTIANMAGTRETVIQLATVKRMARKSRHPPHAWQSLHCTEWKPEGFLTTDYTD